MEIERKKTIVFFTVFYDHRKAHLHNVY